MYGKQRFVALFMAVVMVLTTIGFVPELAFAATDGDRDVVSYGTVGEYGAPWRLYDCGTLVVGEGWINLAAANNYSPWLSYQAGIRHIIFEEPIMAGYSLSGLFAGLTELLTIEGLDYFDTSRVEYMAGMFRDTDSLVGLSQSEEFYLGLAVEDLSDNLIQAADATLRTLTGVAANGTANTVNTTVLTLTFNGAVTGTILPADVSVDIATPGATGSITVVGVGGSGTTRTVNIVGTWEQGDWINVSMASAGAVTGYSITGQPAAQLHRATIVTTPPPATAISAITLLNASLFVNMANIAGTQDAIFTVTGTNLTDLTAASFAPIIASQPWVTFGAPTLSDATLPGASTLRTLTIPVNVAANTGTTTRSATVTVNNGVTPAQTSVLAVSQLAPTPTPPTITTITPTDPTITTFYTAPGLPAAAANGLIAEFTVVGTNLSALTAANFTIQGRPAWLPAVGTHSIVYVAANGQSATIRVFSNVQANTTTAERTATITITNNISAAMGTWNVRQAGVAARTVTSITPTTPTTTTFYTDGLPSTAETGLIAEFNVVGTNLDGITAANFTIQRPTWLPATPPTLVVNVAANGESATLSVFSNLQANTTPSERTAPMTITTNLGGAIGRLDVRQDGIEITTPSVTSITPTDPTIATFYTAGLSSAADTGLIAEFSIVGTNLQGITAANFTVQRPTWLPAAPPTLVVNAAANGLSATLSVFSNVQANTTGSARTAPIIITTNLGGTFGRLDVQQHAVDPLNIISITIIPAVQTQFNNIEYGGVTNQAAIFTIAGTNLAALTLADFLPPIISPTGWVHAAGPMVLAPANALGTSRTLTVPLTVDPNPSPADRGPVDITIVNTVNPAATGGTMTVNQRGTTPITITAFRPAIETRNDFGDRTDYVTTPPLPIVRTGQAARLAIFEIEGSNLTGLTAANFDVVAAFPNWITATPLAFLPSPDGNTATITLTLTVAENPDDDSRYHLLEITNPVAPAAPARLIINQDGRDPVYVNTITANTIIAATFLGIDPEGVEDQYAEFSISGENFDRLTASHFYITGLLPWITYGAFDLTVTNPTTATLRIPFTVTANPSSQYPRPATGTVPVRIGNTTSAEADVLQVSQLPAIPPDIDTFVLTNAADFVGIDAEGGTITAVFTITGTNLSALYINDFNVSVPPAAAAWITRGEISRTVNAAGTLATINIPFTIVRNNSVTPRGPVTIPVSYGPDGATPDLIVNQLRMDYPEIDAIVPTPATVTALREVAATGGTVSAVFTVRGTGLGNLDGTPNGISAANFSVATTLPSWIPSVGTITLSPVNAAGERTLTVPLTVSANPDIAPREVVGITVVGTNPGAGADVTSAPPLTVRQLGRVPRITAINFVPPFVNVPYGGVENQVATFNIVGEFLDLIPLTLANFSVTATTTPAGGVSDWLSFGAINLTNETATGATLTVPVTVAANYTSVSRSFTITINNNLDNSPAVGTLPNVVQARRPAIITSIAPNAATVEAFAAVTANGVMNQNAVFIIEGTNLDGGIAVASFNHVAAGLPPWVSVGVPTALAIDPAGTTATLTVPISVAVSTFAEPRSVDVTITNTINAVTGDLTVTQIGATTVISSIVPASPTVTAFTNVPIAGRTAEAVFVVTGVGLPIEGDDALSLANFEIVTPPWVSAGAAAISSVTSTNAVITMTLTVEENPAILNRQDYVLVNNDITPLTVGELLVSQAGTPPGISSITPTDATLEAFEDVVAAGITHSAVFYVEGTNLEGLTVDNFDIAALPAWITAAEALQLSPATATGAALTVSLTVAANTGAARASNITINNTVTPAVSGTLPVNQVAVDAVPPIPATNITLSRTHGHVGIPFTLNPPNAVFHPENSGEGRTISWEVVESQAASFAATGIQRGPLPTGILNATGAGAVNVRGTVVGTELVRDFTIIFSAESITVEVQGLESLHTGREVSGRIIFTLTDGYFNDPIFPEDFTVSGLPIGLRADPAVRINYYTVIIPIFGAPGRDSVSDESRYLLHVPPAINARNIRQGVFNVGVLGRENLVVGPVGRSAQIHPGSIIFDLNFYGEMHRDAHISLQMNQELRGIFYGAVELREGIDFTRLGDNFIILTAFLNRLPIGTWELEFAMRAGANPVVELVVIDTTHEGAVEEEPIDPGLPPVPPPSLQRPDAGFIYLTGNAAIDTNAIGWDIGRARVNPQVIGGQANVTVRAFVLDDLSWRMPNTSFEIHTPLARLQVPTDILDIIFGGRIAIINSGFNYEQVDVRFSLIDRSGVPAHEEMFRATYPYGQILSPLVELRIEFLHNGTVFFTAEEFTRPLDMTFVVMGTAGHLRPAGMFFHPNRIEFAPYRTFTPNEITVRSIFPGVHGVVHNNAYFQDIPRQHWGFEQAYTAAYSALVANVPNLNFETITTRGEFVQLLANALQLPRATVVTSGYADVPPGHAFYDGVSRARAAGLLGLWNGNYFSPNAPISRQEMAAIVGTALMVGNPVQQPQTIPISGAFLDSASISTHHVPAVQYAINFQIVSGHPNRTFLPAQSATRIEALEAVINLARAMGLLD